MCRLLAIKSDEFFNPIDLMKDFARKCEESSEFQGDGWGFIARGQEGWVEYYDLKPIWEGDFSVLTDINLLLVHARSAYNGESIGLENNMPFKNQNDYFIFNGELNGVKVREEGRIGAEKLFNFLQRFKKENWGEAISRGMKVVEKKTDYIRASNFILLDTSIDKLHVYSHFNEENEYFEMYETQGNGKLVICSEKLSGFNWITLQNKSLKEYS